MDKLNLIQKVSRNHATFDENSLRLNVQPIVQVDHLPQVLRLSGRSSSDLESNHDKASASELGKEMRLDSADETAIVPVQKVSLQDCLNKIHRSTSRQ